MKELYLDYLAQKKDAKKLAYDVLEERTNISRSKLQRIFTGQLDVTVADLEIIVEKGFEESTVELYAQMGKREFADSEDVDYKGAKELIADFNAEKEQIRQEYDLRINQSIKAREDAQRTFDTMLSHVEEQYRKNANYLIDLVKRSEKLNAQLTERAVRAENEASQANRRAGESDARADSAELENRSTRKKMYKLFSGMLAVILILLSFTIFLIVADVPHLGGGNL